MFLTFGLMEISENILQWKFPDLRYVHTFVYIAYIYKHYSSPLILLLSKYLNADIFWSPLILLLSKYLNADIFWSVLDVFVSFHIGY